MDLPTWSESKEKSWVVAGWNKSQAMMAHEHAHLVHASVRVEHRKLNFELVNTYNSA